VPFTRNWRFGAADGWGGYRVERDALLDVMFKASVSQRVGVVVVSGDRHEMAATRFRDPKARGGVVVELSVSPLSMFYGPIRTYRESEGEERLAYFPDGSVKWGAADIMEAGRGEQSKMRFRLFVDGKEKWEHTLLSP
jgi:alkaline phosphatase D